MRGKLRDKRSDAKRDIFKRDVIERRRVTNRRDNRSLIWLNQSDEDDNQSLEEETTEEENPTEVSTPPQPLQPQKATR